jgi:hypothetical protein
LSHLAWAMGAKAGEEDIHITGENSICHTLHSHTKCGYEDNRLAIWCEYWNTGRVRKAHMNLESQQTGSGCEIMS